MVRAFAIHHCTSGLIPGFGKDFVACSFMLLEVFFPYRHKVSPGTCDVCLMLRLSIIILV